MKTLIKTLAAILFATAGFLLPAISSAQFNTIWTRTSNPSSSVDEAYGITADGSGIYVVGRDNVVLDEWRIEKRSLTTGALIAAFGTGGVVTTDPSSDFDYALAVTANANGIYVAGFDMSPGGGDSQWRIEKRNLTTGALIAAFGTGGVITYNPNIEGDLPYAITADAGGIYMAGSEGLGAGDNQWLIQKRNLTTGAIIWTRTSDPSVGDDYALAVTADASGVYVAGTDFSPGDYQWRIEKRSLTTGNLIAAFGTGGVITSNPSASYDRAYAITANVSGIYVAGDNPWRIEKRDLTTGVLIAAFGTGGVVTSLTGNANGITANASGIYVTGGSGGGAWLTEQRDLTTGALLCSHTSNPSGNNDWAQAITADASGIYVAGMDRSLALPNDQWRIEKYDGICTVLPVELLGFSGYNKEEVNVLEWTIASETNNDYFTIERSHLSPSGGGGGFEWIPIGTVKGAGNYSTIRKYEFTDTELPTGFATFYYRLKQVDYDGRYEYYGPVAVKVSSSDEWQLILQSPQVTEQLTGTLLLPNDADITLDIIDLQGRFVKREMLSAVKGSNMFTIDLNDAEKGVYFIKIYNSNNSVNRKFVKM